MALGDFVQNKHAFNAAAASLPTTFDFTVTNGNSIVVVVFTKNGSPTCTDSGGNAYTLYGTNISTSFFLASNIVGGSSFTVTPAGSSGRMHVEIIEFEGALAFDQEAFVDQQGAATNPFNTGNLTTTDAIEAFVGYFYGLSNPTSDPSGYTRITNNSAENFVNSRVWVNRVTSIGTYSLQANQDGGDHWIGLYTFKAATGGGGGGSSVHNPENWYYRSLINNGVRN